MMRRWTLILVTLEFVVTFAKMLPLQASALGDPISITQHEWVAASPSVADRLRRLKLLNRGMHYNEVEACRTTDDPFEVPSQVVADPNTGEAGAPAREPTDRIVLYPIRIGRSDHPQAYHPQNVGDCVNDPLYRPTVVLTPQEMALFGLKPQADYRAIANVRGLTQFYIAWVDLRSVQDLIIQNVQRPLLKLGGKTIWFGRHMQLRVTFSRPVKLIPQWPLQPGKTSQTRELTLSAEGISKEDAARDFFGDASDGSYLLINATLTKEFKTFEEYLYYSDWEGTTAQIKQFTLTLSAADKRKVLEYFWNQADQTLTARHFFITGTNCKVGLMQVFDHALTYTAQQRDNVASEGWLTRILPDALEQSLKNRGLVTNWGQATRPNFEDEPDTQAVLAWLRSLNSKQLQELIGSDWK